MLQILRGDGASSVGRATTTTAAGVGPLGTDPDADFEDADTSRLLTIAAVGFEAAVTCAVGEQRGDSDSGTAYLTYLSLLGPATTVVAIWANLMDHRQAVVTLEGVGQVQLWQRQPELANLGYRIAWRRRHQVLSVVGGARVVHLITEPDLLTVRDPQLADVAVRRRHQRRSAEGASEAGEGGEASALEQRGGRDRGKGKGNGAEGGKRLHVADEPVAPSRRGGQSAQQGGRPGDPAATDPSAAQAQAQAQEQAARETRPIFVLLRRAGEDEHTVACRHLLYLAQRVQWLAYYEPWAEFVWRRGLQTGEITPLSVWPAAADAGQPFIAHAYLCRPEPLALALALPEAIAAMNTAEAVQARVA
jgi:hypothetical protein